MSAIASVVINGTETSNPTGTITAEKKKMVDAL